MYRLFLALRYLRSRLVNLISIGGVMAGVAVLIVVVSIMDGFQERVRRSVRGTLSHLVMTPSPSGDPPPKDWYLPFDELERRLLEDDRIEAAAPQIRMPVAYPYQTPRLSWMGVQNRALFQMEAVGIDWARETRVSDLGAYLVAGNPEDPFLDELARAREISTVLVGGRWVDSFTYKDIQTLTSEGQRVWTSTRLDPTDFEPLVTGQLLDRDGVALNRIRIQYATVEEEDGEMRFVPNSANPLIKGVFDSGDAPDKTTMYFHIDDLRRLGGFGHEYLEARIKLKDYRDAEAVKWDLIKRFKHYDTETWEDLRRDYLSAVNSEKIMLVIVLSFIVLLGGFIILATLTLTVVEKTKDIGILGALGAPRRGILSVFIWNGLLIGMIGSVLGLGLGYLFVKNVDGVRDFIRNVSGYDVFPQNIYRFESIPTVWDWPSIIAIMVGSLAVAFFAGLVPALRAARLDPVKALRYE